MRSLVPWRNKRSDIESSVFEPTFRQLRQEMNRFFDRVTRDPFSLLSDPGPALGDWVPSLDIAESEKAITVRVEVPGVDPKDLDITVSGNVLTVAGRKNDVTERKGENWFHAERRFGAFRRSVQLPADVDPDKVSAEHANGVLTIQLERVKSAARKRVPVKVS